MIERFLEDLEARIDEEAERDLHADWREFADGDYPGVLFDPHRPAPAPPRLEWPKVLVNEAWHDLEKMALQQFGGCSQTLADGGGAVLNVRANYGTCILPSPFGVRYFFMEDAQDTLPTNWPIDGGPDAIRRLLDRGVPEPTEALLGRCLETAQYYLEITRSFPKISRWVHIYHPDLQGPMDVCELIWGSRMYLDVWDVPGLMKDFLALLTETYIRFMREWDRLVPFEQGYAAHWGVFHKGHITLRDDSAINFSPEMFREFIQPYDQRLLNELGGGIIHYCGRGDHFIADLTSMRNLHGVHLSQPHLNDMDRIFDATTDRAVPLYMLLEPFARAALDRGRKIEGLVHVV